jgi:hypothetical protein
MNRLFAGRVVSERTDKHTASLLLCLAVRLAAMAEPTCSIPAACTVDDVSVVEPKEKRVAILGPVALTAPACDAPGGHFTFVFDESLPEGDGG